MANDLTDADKAILVKLLRETIAADKYPLSPRVRAWRAVLEKLDPPPPRPEPIPAPPVKPYVPSMIMAKRRTRRR